MGSLLFVMTGAVDRARPTPAGHCLRKTQNAEVEDMLSVDRLGASEHLTSFREQCHLRVVLGLTDRKVRVTVSVKCGLVHVTKTFAVSTVCPGKHHPDIDSSGLSTKI